MGLKTAGAKLLLKGGLINRTVYIAAMRSATLEFAAAAQNGYATYARISKALADWTRTNAGLAENTAAWDFPAPGADSTATPTHWAIYDAAANGNLLAVQALTGSPVAPTLGAAFGFDAGALELAHSAGKVTALGMKRAYESGLVSGTTYLGMFENQPSGSDPQPVDDRLAIAEAGWTYQATAENNVRNNAELDFGVQAADVDTPMWFGLYDAANAGNLLWEDQIDVTPDDPDQGATLSVAVNKIVIGFTVDAS